MSSPTCNCVSFFCYQAKFTEICINLFNFGLTELDRRNKEIEAFNACIEEAKEENKQNAMTHIAKFHDYQLKVPTAN